MASDPSIPVFMIGRSAENAKVLLPALKPRFDVVHFCTSTATAREELPFALQEKEIKIPSTILGSNTQRGPSPRTPAAIFVGAGFTREDYEGFRADVRDIAGDDVVWVREEKSDIEGLEDPVNWVVREGVGKVPRPEVLVKSIRKCLERDCGLL